MSEEMKKYLPGEDLLQICGQGLMKRVDGRPEVYLASEVDAALTEKDGEIIHLSNIRDGIVWAAQEKDRQIDALTTEIRKYKAFWEQAREVEKMNFERFEWEPLGEDFQKVLNEVPYEE